MYAGPVIDQRAPSEALDRARDALRAKGMRWTPQRRALLELIFESDGHITGAEVLERARARDPETQGSTVYRTLDAIEEIGLVVHSHGRDGREEYHVLSAREHGHLTCDMCGSVWELGPEELRRLANELRRSRGFELDVSHVGLVGRCKECSMGAPA